SISAAHANGPFVPAATICRKLASPSNFLFFFNDTATTEIYTLSLHDALPILSDSNVRLPYPLRDLLPSPPTSRSEEHTSELQSLTNLVCRLLLEKKKIS